MVMKFSLVLWLVLASCALLIPRMCEAKRVSWPQPVKEQTALSDVDVYKLALSYLGDRDFARARAKFEQVLALDTGGRAATGSEVGLHLLDAVNKTATGVAFTDFICNSLCQLARSASGATFTAPGATTYAFAKGRRRQENTFYANEFVRLLANQIGYTNDDVMEAKLLSSSASIPSSSSLPSRLNVQKSSIASDDVVIPPRLIVIIRSIPSHITVQDVLSDMHEAFASKGIAFVWAINALATQSDMFSFPDHRYPVIAFDSDVSILTNALAPHPVYAPTLPPLAFGADGSDSSAAATAGEAQHDSSSSSSSSPSDPRDANPLASTADVSHLTPCTPSRAYIPSPIAKALFSSPAQSLHAALAEWVREGSGGFVHTALATPSVCTLISSSSSPSSSSSSSSSIDAFAQLMHIGSIASSLSAYSSSPTAPPLPPLLHLAHPRIRVLRALFTPSLIATAPISRGIKLFSASNKRILSVLTASSHPAIATSLSAAAPSALSQAPLEYVSPDHVALPLPAKDVALDDDAFVLTAFVALTNEYNREKMFSCARNADVVATSHMYKRMAAEAAAATAAAAGSIAATATTAHQNATNIKHTAAAAAAASSVHEDAYCPCMPFLAPAPGIQPSPISFSYWKHMYALLPTLPELEATLPISDSFSSIHRSAFNVDDMLKGSPFLGYLRWLRSRYQPHVNALQQLLQRASSSGHITPGEPIPSTSSLRNLLALIPMRTRVLEPAGGRPASKALIPLVSTLVPRPASLSPIDDVAVDVDCNRDAYVHAGNTATVEAIAEPVGAYVITDRYTMRRSARPHHHPHPRHASLRPEQQQGQGQQQQQWYRHGVADATPSTPSSPLLGDARKSTEDSSSSSSSSTSTASASASPSSLSPSSSSSSSSSVCSEATQQAHFCEPFPTGHPLSLDKSSPSASSSYSSSPYLSSSYLSAAIGDVASLDVFAHDHVTFFPIAVSHPSSSSDSSREILASISATGVVSSMQDEDTNTDGSSSSSSATAASTAEASGRDDVLHSFSERTSYLPFVYQSAGVPHLWSSEEASDILSSSKTTKSSSSSSPSSPLSSSLSANDALLYGLPFTRVFRPYPSPSLPTGPILHNAVKNTLQSIHPLLSFIRYYTASTTQCKEFAHALASHRVSAYVDSGGLDQVKEESKMQSVFSDQYDAAIASEVDTGSILTPRFPFFPALSFDHERKGLLLMQQRAIAQLSTFAGSLTEDDEEILKAADRISAIRSTGTVQQQQHQQQQQELHNDVSSSSTTTSTTASTTSESFSSSSSTPFLSGCSESAERALAVERARLRILTVRRQDRLSMIWANDFATSALSAIDEVEKRVQKVKMQECLDGEGDGQTYESLLQEVLMSTSSSSSIASYVNSPSHVAASVDAYVVDVYNHVVQPTKIQLSKQKENKGNGPTASSTASSSSASSSSSSSASSSLSSSSSSSSAETATSSSPLSSLSPSSTAAVSVSVDSSSSSRSIFNALSVENSVAILQPITAAGHRARHVDDVAGLRVLFSSLAIPQILTRSFFEGLLEDAEKVGGGSQ